MDLLLGKLGASAFQVHPLRAPPPQSEALGSSPEYPLEIQATPYSSSLFLRRVSRNQSSQKGDEGLRAKKGPKARVWGGRCRVSTWFLWEPMEDGNFVTRS